MRKKTDSLRQSESKREKELELSVQDVLVVPGNRVDEQVAVRHLAAFGGDIRENQQRR